jgi:hypothetical protein
MRTTAIVSRWVTRITGLIQIVLGLLFWIGAALNLVPLHIISGILLVIALWVLAIMAISSGAGPRQGIVSLIWGLVVLVLGMTQGRIFVDSAHWVIQVVHLLIGIGAIGQAETLASRILNRQLVTA